jgi:hypothetical protein
VTIGAIAVLMWLTMRTDPEGCIVFFAFVFLSCLVGMILPQLFLR